MLADRCILKARVYQPGLVGWISPKKPSDSKYTSFLPTILKALIEDQERSEQLSSRNDLTFRLDQSLHRKNGNTLVITKHSKFTPIL